MDDTARLAYLGGFFDGEGSIYILRQRSVKTTDNFFLEVSFTSSDIAPLELAHTLFGGGISRSGDGRGDRKPIFRLRIRSQQAGKALSILLPFLIVKRERAEVALEFQALMSAPRVSAWRGRNVSTQVAEQYKARITNLNDKAWNRNKLTV